MYYLKKTDNTVKVVCFLLATLLRYASFDGTLS